MKLKDIYQNHKTLVHLTGLALALVLGIIAWAWFGASSEISVPKAERYEANSNIEAQKAITVETQANAIREQRIEARAETVKSKGTLNQRKIQYEKVRKTPLNNSGSDADLTVRERNLRSDLERLYPANR